MMINKRIFIDEIQPAFFWYLALTLSTPCHLPYLTCANCPPRRRYHDFFFFFCTVSQPWRALARCSLLRSFSSLSNKMTGAVVGAGAPEHDEDHLLEDESPLNQETLFQLIQEEQRLHLQPNGKDEDGSQDAGQGSKQAQANSKAPPEIPLWKQELITRLTKQRQDLFVNLEASLFDDQHQNAAKTSSRTPSSSLHVVRKVPELYTWGEGCNGQLGYLKNSFQQNPKRVDKLPTGIQTWTGSRYHTVVVVSGQTDGVEKLLLNTGARSHQRNSASTRGGKMPMTMTFSDRLYSWGTQSARFPRLGRAEGTSDEIPGPLSIPATLNSRFTVRRLSCGRDHTLILAQVASASAFALTLFGFGSNEHGQLLFSPAKRPVVPEITVLPFESKMTANIAPGSVVPPGDGVDSQVVQDQHLDAGATSVCIADAACGTFHSVIVVQERLDSREEARRKKQPGSTLFSTTAKTASSEGADHARVKVRGNVYQFGVFAPPSISNCSTAKANRTNNLAMAPCPRLTHLPEMDAPPKNPFHLGRRVSHDRKLFYSLEIEGNTTVLRQPNHSLIASTWDHSAGVISRRQVMFDLSSSSSVLLEGSGGATNGSTSSSRTMLCGGDADDSAPQYRNKHQFYMDDEWQIKMRRPEALKVTLRRGRLIVIDTFHRLWIGHINGDDPAAGSFSNSSSSTTSASTSSTTSSTSTYNQQEPVTMRHFLSNVSDACYVGSKTPTSSSTTSAATEQEEFLVVVRGIGEDKDTNTHEENVGQDQADEQDGEAAATGDHDTEERFDDNVAHGGGNTASETEASQQVSKLKTFGLPTEAKLVRVVISVATPGSKDASTKSPRDDDGGFTSVVSSKKNKNNTSSSSMTCKTVLTAPSSSSSSTANSSKTKMIFSLHDFEICPFANNYSSSRRYYPTRMLGLPHSVDFGHEAGVGRMVLSFYRPSINHHIDATQDRWTESLQGGYEHLYSSSPSRHPTISGFGMRGMDHLPPLEEDFQIPIPSFSTSSSSTALPVSPTYATLTSAFPQRPPFPADDITIPVPTFATATAAATHPLDITPISAPPQPDSSDDSENGTKQNSPASSSPSSPSTSKKRKRRPPSLVFLCEVAIMRQITPRNALDTLDYALGHDLGLLWNYCLRILFWNLRDVQLLHEASDGPLAESYVGALMLAWLENGQFVGRRDPVLLEIFEAFQAGEDFHNTHPAMEYTLKVWAAGTEGVHLFPVSPGTMTSYNNMIPSTNTLVQPGSSASAASSSCAVLPVSPQLQTRSSRKNSTATSVSPISPPDLGDAGSSSNVSFQHLLQAAYIREVEFFAQRLGISRCRLDSGRMDMETFAATKFLKNILEEGRARTSLNEQEQRPSSPIPGGQVSTNSLGKNVVSPVLATRDVKSADDSNATKQGQLQSKKVKRKKSRQLHKQPSFLGGQPQLDAAGTVDKDTQEDADRQLALSIANAEENNDEAFLMSNDTTAGAGRNQAKAASSSSTSTALPSWSSSLFKKKSLFLSGGPTPPNSSSSSAYPHDVHFGQGSDIDDTAESNGADWTAVPSHGSKRKSGSGGRKSEIPKSEVVSSSASSTSTSIVVINGNGTTSLSKENTAASSVLNGASDQNTNKLVLGDYVVSKPPPSRSRASTTTSMVTPSAGGAGASSSISVKNGPGPPSSGTFSKNSLPLWDMAPSSSTSSANPPSAMSLQEIFQEEEGAKRAKELERAKRQERMKGIVTKNSSAATGAAGSSSTSSVVADPARHSGSGSTGTSIANNTMNMKASTSPPTTNGRPSGAPSSSLLGLGAPSSSSSSTAANDPTRNYWGSQALPEARRAAAMDFKTLEDLERIEREEAEIAEIEARFAALEVAEELERMEKSKENVEGSEYAEQTSSTSSKKNKSCKGRGGRGAGGCKAKGGSGGKSNGKGKHQTSNSKGETASSARQEEEDHEPKAKIKGDGKGKKGNGKKGKGKKGKTDKGKGVAHAEDTEN
ncbi:unnamed protein product [Amoebophrya sp. A25]|nr:unnamed protein product [Amoebophrya sp. A25]|eukprot:GSA25T00010232001.1